MRGGDVLRALCLAAAAACASCTYILGLENLGEAPGGGGAGGGAGAGSGGGGAGTGAMGGGGSGYCAPCGADCNNDRNHCGGCDQACEDDAECTGGFCASHTVSGSETAPEGIIVDTGGNVYWRIATLRVRRLTLGTGVVDGPINYDPEPLFEMAISGGHLFGASANKVIRWEIANESNTEELQSGSVIRDIAADETAAYWLDANASAVKWADTTATDGMDLITGEGNLLSLAVDAGNLYWISDDVIRTAPTGGGMPETRGTLADVDLLAVDGQYLCARYNQLKDVQCMLAATGQQPVDFNVLDGDITGIDVAGGFVYWTESMGGVRRARIAQGAQPELLDQAAGSATSIAVHVEGTKHRIYWTDAVGGRVVKVVRWGNN